MEFQVETSRCILAIAADPNNTHLSKKRAEINLPIELDKYAVLICLHATPALVLGE